MSSTYTFMAVYRAISKGGKISLILRPFHLHSAKITGQRQEGTGTGSALVPRFPPIFVPLFLHCEDKLVPTSLVFYVILGGMLHI